jgi:hypothetical protein
MVEVEDVFYCAETIPTISRTQKGIPACLFQFKGSFTLQCALLTERALPISLQVEMTGNYCANHGFTKLYV